MPVGGPAWRQPDAWGNPAGWALEQAGEAIGGFLGVDEDPPSPQQLGPADQAGGDVQQDVPMVTARDGRTYPELSSLPEERWRQVQLTTPEFKRGTQWVRTYGPIRIAHYNAGANEEVVPEYSAGGPRRPHGGHATSLSGPSYEYLYPEQPSEHGWWVEITIPQQPAVNGATIGNTLRVHRLVEKAE